MPNYAEMYLTMFRAATRAIELPEQESNTAGAAEILKQAQLDAEEIFIASAPDC